MHEQIRSILRRFKEFDLFVLFSNKENDYRFQSNNKDQILIKQELNRENKRERAVRELFESLISDANRMHLCYEEMLHEANISLDGLKQELSQCKHAHEEEKIEAEKLIGELNLKIDCLNRQIANKQEDHRQIVEKYDEIIEHANELHMEETKQVKQLQSERFRESMHFEHEMKMSFKEIDEAKLLLAETIESNENLLKQNLELKNRNEKLVELNEYLKNKLDSQKFNKLIRLQNKEDEEEQSLGSIERCDFESASRGSKYGMDEIKVDNSSQSNFMEEKELLNLSEHYSKFNRTQQLRNKESEIDYNDAKSIVKKYQTTKNALAKIDDLFQRDSPAKNSSVAAVSLKSQQIQCGESAFKIQVIDPYRAFFQLLIQCQKLNSPYFNRISHIDISYLFEEMIEGYIPYNLWQDEIKKVLQSKINNK